MLPCGCVWCVHVCAHVLGPCLHVCVFVQADSLGVRAWCVCVWVTVSGAVHVSVGLCMSLFVCLCYAAKSSLASNDKQEFSRRLVKRGLVKIVI